MELSSQAAVQQLTSFPLFESPRWQDYALLDSGEGAKLERFGKYVFQRPEAQAMWKRALPESDWAGAHAIFRPTGEESGGHWEFKHKIEERWEMRYPLLPPPSVPPSASQESENQDHEKRRWGDERGVLRFWAMTTPGRHLGVFPEGAANWDWINDLIARSKRPVNVLNLFSYTGLGTLAAAAAGAKVTHVDASKKAVTWARENQALSGLTEKPVRWLVDDALKFVQREARRGIKYDGILLDPPKFGRGPKGEVWEIYKSLPNLLAACRACMSDQPIFIVLSVYAVRASAVHLAQVLGEMTKEFGGNVDSGELVTREQSAGRLLSQAVFARWKA